MRRQYFRANIVIFQQETVNSRADGRDHITPIQGSRSTVAVIESSYRLDKAYIRVEPFEPSNEHGIELRRRVCEMHNVDFAQVL